MKISFMSNKEFTLEDYAITVHRTTDGKMHLYIEEEGVFTLQLDDVDIKKLIGVIEATNKIIEKDSCAVD